ncbi:MAG: hypothetical protein ACQEUK_16935, partial [Pseudomonadota bacterium]
TVMDTDGVTVGGTSVNDPTTTIGAGVIEVTGTGGAGANTVAIDGDAGTISGLTNTTFDPNATYTGGQAATQEQLTSVSNVANAGWNVTDGTNTANIGPNGDVTFTGDSNIA